MIVKYFLIFLALFWVCESESCPEGFVDPGSTAEYCYMISLEPMDWGTSQEVVND